MSSKGMKPLKILVYQAETIENALRLAIRTLGSRTESTAMDREIMLADKHIKSVLKQLEDGN